MQDCGRQESRSILVSAARWTTIHVVHAVADT